MEALPYFLVPKGSSADGDEHVLKIKYYYFKVKRNIVFTFFRSWGGGVGGDSAITRKQKRSFL